MNNAPPDSGTVPANRIDLINSSLRCFTYSLVGLIPVLGVPCWVAAIVQGQKVKRAARGHWNPAARYVNLAGWMIPLSVLTNAGFLLAAAVIISISTQGGGGCSSGVG